MPGTNLFQTVAVRIPVGQNVLDADLNIPAHAIGLVIFAHGSGSGLRSPRNQFVARALQAHGLGTLLANLLTAEEDAIDQMTGHVRFNIDLLGLRVTALIDWARHSKHGGLPIGLFGASTGAAAALVAAAARPRDIAAVVSRGGRPDLAGDALPRVTAPTELLVGGLDVEVIELNKWALARMRCPVTLTIIPGASHLFEERGALETVAERAGAWFVQHLAATPQTAQAASEKENSHVR